MSETTTRSGYRVTQAGRPGGPKVLFVHGQVFHRGAWLPTQQRLSDLATAAVDLPWHGDSPAPEGVGLEEMASAVLEALDVLGWQRAVLVGHSLGCLAVLEATARDATRVAGCLLVGPMGEANAEEQARSGAPNPLFPHRRGQSV